MYKLKIRLLNSPVQARVVVSARVLVEKCPGWHFYRLSALILVLTALLYGDSMFLTARVIEQESTNNTPQKTNNGNTYGICVLHIFFLPLEHILTPLCVALSSNLCLDYFCSQSIKSTRNQTQGIRLGDKHPYPPSNLAVL